MMVTNAGIPSYTFTRQISRTLLYTPENKISSTPGYDQLISAVAFIIIEPTKISVHPVAHGGTNGLSVKSHGKCSEETYWRQILVQRKLR